MVSNFFELGSGLELGSAVHFVGADSVVLDSVVLDSAEFDSAEFDSAEYGYVEHSDWPSPAAHPTDSCHFVDFAASFSTNSSQIPVQWNLVSSCPSSPSTLSQSLQNGPTHLEHSTVLLVSQGSCKGCVRSGWKVGCRLAGLTEDCRQAGSTWAG